MNLHAYTVYCLSNYTAKCACVYMHVHVGAPLHIFVLHSHHIRTHARMHTANLMKRVLESAPNVGQYMEYVMATGNIKSQSGLGLQQVSTH